MGSIPRTLRALLCLIRQSCPTARWLPALPAFLPALAILVLMRFSPMQYENWLWAVQIAFFLPMACVVWALVVLLKLWHWSIRLIAALLLALVGTHSFGHGFVVWPAVLGVVLLKRDFGGRPHGRWWFAGLWAASAAIVILCYTQLDFQNVSHSTHSYGQGPGLPPPPPCIATRWPGIQPGSPGV